MDRLFHCKNYVPGLASSNFGGTGRLSVADDIDSAGHIAGHRNNLQRSRQRVPADADNYARTVHAAVGRKRLAGLAGLRLAEEEVENPRRVKGAPTLGVRDTHPDIDVTKAMALPPLFQ